MGDRPKCIVGTSGYSFADWVGPFYRPGTRGPEMFEQYAARFATAELNYTYYRMPAAKTLASLAGRSPTGFDFWVKANQEITHRQNLQPAPAFLDALAPLREAGKLAGVLLQFPQGFHRTVSNRKYLAQAVDTLQAVPLAVEFRHRSWEDPATAAGLRDRHVTLFVPDVPDLPDLYHSPALATTGMGYLRLHSRNAGKWYAGEAERYDYSYTEDEMRNLLQEWSLQPVGRVYAYFNNCHGGQAPANAAAFRQLAEQWFDIPQPQPSP